MNIQQQKKRLKANKSLAGIFLVGVLFVTFIPTAIVGYFWIREERQTFVRESALMKKNFLSEHKNRIKQETRRVLDYIRFTRANIDKNLRRQLKERVYEAYQIAGGIYNRFHNQLNTPRIEEMILAALRPIRFNRDRGYYYIYRMDGTLLLYPVKPETEGSNQFDLRDKRGVYVVRKEIAAAKQYGEGFVVNTAAQAPGDPETIFPKIVFVKTFKPLNWYIGSKEYRVDFVAETQKAVLNRISNIRFGQDGYVFVFSLDGDVLLNASEPGMEGQNIWNVEGEDGKVVFRKISSAARSDGGDFVQYSWRRPSTGQVSRKLSYVARMDDWKWIVGAGVYLDEIDHAIAAKSIAMKQAVKNQFLKIALLFLILFVVAVLITLLFSRIVRKEFKVFMNFFKRAAVSHEPIDKEKLFALEFRNLADSVNEMLDERRKVEISLKESEERLAVTFRSIADGVISTDTHNRIILLNRTAEKLTGWTHHEAFGKPLAEIFKPERQNGGWFLLSLSGDKIPIEYKTAPIHDKDNEFIGSVILFQDIAEKQKIENELRKAQRLESLGLLAGGIAHDFNNLLTSVLGNINLAKNLVTKQDKVYHPLTVAEDATLRTRNLTRQLLTFSRGGAPVKMVHDIGELIHQSVTFTLRGSSVKAEFNVLSELWPVEVDDGQMNQVFNNLVINAVQAMPRGGLLRINAENVLPKDLDAGLPLVEQYDRYVKITVRDNGDGIPADVLPKIFDPYFTTKSGGSGLGLASVYSVVRKHGGHIEALSEPGQGTTFTLYIPACSHCEKPDPHDNQEESKTIDPDHIHGRILVMDDDDLVGDIVVRQLEFLGFQAELVQDGRQAIDRYKEALNSNHPVDIILMDLTIPGGMGGAEAMKRLLEIDPNVKAVVSSGYSNDPIMADYKKHGFKDCLVKPYKLDDLSDSLLKILECSD